jgi:Neocarzinostatin family
VAPAGRASALGLHLTRLSVTPSSKLISDQSVSVSVSGGYAGTTYAVAICGPKVFRLLVPPTSVQDGCDATHNTVITVNASGQARTALAVPALLTTATGGVDCRQSGCFLGLVALHGTGTLGLGDLLWKRLSFAADACDPPGNCAVPADAWDPSLGRLPGTHLATAAGGPAPEPITLTLRPGLAGGLDAPGSVTGPAWGYNTGPSAGGSAQSGEGLLRLDLEAPGTSWGPGTPSSTVVDATLTDISTGRQVGEQRFVLFWGARPFVYAGFTGPVTTADRYRVSLRIEPPAGAGGLSQPAPNHRPGAVLRDAALEVVTSSSPSYLAYAYAPVLYGRTTSALHDVPLLVYAAATPEPGGGTRLAYTYVFSHEDAGTGFSPFMEYGSWGRTTDIETALSFTVGANGAVHDAEYLWGGQPATGFPDSRTSLREVDEPFDGTWIGHHPVIRDATGNNDFAESGTTPFRFQLAPVAPPGPAQAREAVMDANPFTYQVMAAELARWHASTSGDPASPEPGDIDQYALVDLNTVNAGGTSSRAAVSSVAVGVRLAGSPNWYFSDQGRGVTLIGTGHVRTVVKLPRGWASRAVTGVKVAVHPGGAAATVDVVALSLERFDPSALRVYPVAAPAPVVVAA